MENHLRPVPHCDYSHAQAFSGYCCIDSANRNVHCLPLFSIIGIMKCATGVLRKWLSKHPSLVPGQGFKFIGGRKIDTNEVHYFSNQGSKNNSIAMQNYIQFFNVNNDSRVFQFTFDKSPDYIRSPSSIESLNRTVLGIKYIVILRDPVLRSLSEFNHHCRHSRYFRNHLDGSIWFSREKSPSSEKKLLRSCTAEDFHRYLFSPCTSHTTTCQVLATDRRVHHHMDDGSLSLSVRNASSSEGSESAVVVPLRREIASGLYADQLDSLFRMCVSLAPLHSVPLSPTTLNGLLRS